MKSSSAHPGGAELKKLVCAVERGLLLHEPREGRNRFLREVLAHSLRSDEALIQLCKNQLSAARASSTFSSDMVYAVSPPEGRAASG